MKDRLESDPSVKRVVARYVPLRVESSEEWHKVASKIKIDGSATPILVILRADGEQIYAKGGAAPDRFPEFLEQKLSEAGQIPTEKELAKVTKALAAADEAIKSSKPDKAIDAVVKYAQTGCYAEPFVRAAALIVKLGEEGNAALEKAEALFATDTFAGALAVTEATRMYGKLPSLAKRRASVNRLKARAENRDNFRVAGLIDKARQSESKGDLKRALRSYQQIVASEEADSPGGKFAASRASELEKRGVEAAPLTAGKKSGGAEETEDSDGAEKEAVGVPAVADKKVATEQELKKAASLLQLAEANLVARPQKAKSYANQVIKMAAGSEIADKAKRLLERIEDAPMEEP